MDDGDGSTAIGDGDGFDRGAAHVAASAGVEFADRDGFYGGGEDGWADVSNVSHGRRGSIVVDFLGDWAGLRVARERPSLAGS